MRWVSEARHSGRAVQPEAVLLVLRLELDKNWPFPEPKSERASQRGGEGVAEHSPGPGPLCKLESSFRLGNAGGQGGWVCSLHSF